MFSSLKTLNSYLQISLCEFQKLNLYSHKKKTKLFSMLLLFFLISLLTFPVSLYASTVVVDGVSEWKNPQLLVGDSVIFQHKYHYSLCIFKNENAFSLCNFNQATILTKPNSISYTWHTSRPGLFYFSFNNGSNKACVEGQKLAVKVLLPPRENHAAVPEPSRSMAAPSPSTGGIVASSPSFPWPFQPHESMPPSLAPGLAASPVEPYKEGVPFINSNPAVPLPSGEIDSATIRPLPTSGHQQSKQVVGLCAVKGALCGLIFLLMMI